jgi:predicted RND superfamily exporter protein
MVTQMFEKIKANFINFLLNKPKTTLSIGIIIVAAFTSGANYIKSNYTPRAWFDDDYPQIIALDNYEKRFGGDQFLAVGVYTRDGLINEKNLQLLKDITEKLWTISGVIRVDSMTNFNNIRGQGDELDIVPLVDDPINPTDVKKELDSIKEIKNYLIDKEYKFALIYAHMKPLFGERPNYTKIVNELKEMIKPYHNRDNRFILSGNVAVTYAFREIADSDNKKIIPFMFGFIFILLVLFFRSVAGVITPLIISLVTIACTFGVMGHVGLIFNNILAAVPGVLLAICLADTVHVMATFYFKLNTGETVRNSLHYSLDKNFLATILTTVTTAISFFTISSTELIPIRDLGILAGIGTLLAWIFTYLFLPSFFILLPEKMVRMLWNAKNSKTAEESRFSKIIWVYKIPIIALFMVAFGFSIYMALQNEVNSDPLKYFAEDTQLKKDYVFTQKFIDGLRGIELEVDSGENDGIKDPAFLRKVQAFIDEVTAQEDIVLVASILDPLKKMYQSLKEGDPKYYTIPDSKEAVAETLLFYTMGLPPNKGIENMVSMDNRYLRLQLKWNVETTKLSMAKDKEVHEIAKKHGLKTLTGGYFPIYVQVNNRVVESFFKSMAMAIFFVSLIILIVFKDPLLAFLAMMPNVMPLSFGAAYMAFNHIHIDIGTSIVSAICLGIAVDDTIHFIAHYVINKKKFNNTFKALNETFLSTGKALILTTVLLVVGFGSFAMADFLPNHYFGVLCAIVLTFALLTDLFFLPSILTIWYKDERKEMPKVD